MNQNNLLKDYFRKKWDVMKRTDNRTDIYKKIKDQLGRSIDKESAVTEVEELDRIRKEKYEKLRPFLICPVCRKPLKDAKTGLRCRKCKETYPVNNATVNFLPEHLKQQFAIIDTENVSANTGFVLPPEYASFITENRDGLILDCGAGFKGIEFVEKFPNVICYEIVEYASTDVVGVGEKLPFKDATFDVVFSLAVLEHVKNPFTCANEIKRVLKPGGTLVADVPFLQPYHGYPHHYYNMTSQGLQNLFEGLEVKQSHVPPWGQPMHALQWILYQWSVGLSQTEKEKFSEVKVGDLISRPLASLLQEKYVTDLDERQKEIIACVNSLIATKPRSGWRID